ncbi:hypothetical protein GCM10010381_63780 [Streptomyces xantholiticus]|nr:hypothetical protein GCM10010381_63780 [Streptomyces xantholiticus]
MGANSRDYTIELTAWLAQRGSCLTYSVDITITRTDGRAGAIPRRSPLAEFLALARYARRRPPEIEGSPGASIRWLRRTRSRDITVVIEEKQIDAKGFLVTH